MSDGSNPYPTYKDSGVPWLGEMPEHWDDPRLKRAAQLNTAQRDRISP